MGKKNSKNRNLKKERLNIHSINERNGEYILNTEKANKRLWYSAILTWIVI